MCPRRFWKIAEQLLSEVHGKSLDENLSDKNIPLSGYGAPEGQTGGWTTSLFFSSTSPDFDNSLFHDFRIASWPTLPVIVAISGTLAGMVVF